MAKERIDTPDGLVEALQNIAEQSESIYLEKRRNPIINLFNSQGMELENFLDKEHMPQTTNFSTVIVSKEFAPLRGIAPTSVPKIGVEWGGEAQNLLTISAVAARPQSYEKTMSGRRRRARYLDAMSKSARELYRGWPLRYGEIVVPVERCGGNIARHLGLTDTISIEVKRLRFDGFPDLLGAGINLDPLIAERFRGKRVRLLEGVVASGSTEGVVSAAFRNLMIPVESIDCDAVIVCPAGVEFAAEFRRALGVLGEDRSVYAGGVLDKDWYVRYHPDDPLLGYFQTKAVKDYFIGKQVLGDGGDLTSPD